MDNICKKNLFSRGPVWFWWFWLLLGISSWCLVSSTAQLFCKLHYSILFLSLLNNLRNSKHLKAQLGAAAVQTEMDAAKTFPEQILEKPSSCSRMPTVSNPITVLIGAEKKGRKWAVSLSLVYQHATCSSEENDARLTGYDTVQRAVCVEKKERTSTWFCVFKMQEITIIISELHLI